MKFSAKAAPPREFTDWLAPTPTWQPTYGSFAGEPKKATQNALWTEQEGVCCYCGRSLSTDLNDSHIDHFRPQSKFNAAKPPDLTLAYDNFVLSCGPPSLPFGGHLPNTCGDVKGEWFDEAQHIAPWAPTCEARFVYGVLGGIDPAAAVDFAASQMIRVLRLDHPALANERSTILSDLETQIANGAITEANVNEEIALWLITTNGARVGFGHVAARYLEEAFP